MQSVSRSDGRTVLFVSHNLASIRELCSSALLLAGGQVSLRGTCSRVVDAYLHGLADVGPLTVPPPKQESFDSAFVTDLHLETMDGRPLLALPVGHPWRVRVGLRLGRRLRQFIVAIGLKSADGTAVQTVWQPPQDIGPGTYEAVFTQDRVILGTSTYTLVVGLSEEERSLQQFDAARFDVTAEGATDYYPRTAGVGMVLNSMGMTLTRTE